MLRVRYLESTARGQPTSWRAGLGRDMASYGRPPHSQRGAHGRGSSQNSQQGAWGGRGRGGSYGSRGRTPQSHGFTRPYRKRGSGRGHESTVSEMTAVASPDSASRRAKVGKAAALVEPTEPSSALLAQVAAIKESAKRHRGEDVSGSESEEEEDMESSELLKKTLKMYYHDLGSADGEGGPEVSMWVSGSLVMASGSCLVCLSNIKRVEPAWSCRQCYCLFHLQCIQQWARDGVKQHSLLSPELFPAQDLLWSCPKCRREYPQAKFPQKYYCFCGKQVDPPVDPWLLPHSCGDICDRPLQPECGHRCVSLCHPGPCPPCPKMAHVTCYCGRSKPVMKRCGARGWSCGRVCGRVLSCEMHTCEARCHRGDCTPCDQVIEQQCVCGRESLPRPCAAPEWQCTQPCNKLLTCGHHRCDKVCHSGWCGDCPRSGTRTCPCGKTRHTLPCTEEVPTCGDTCNKDLPCGRHSCMRQCHHGDCDQCLQMALKRCRCGRKEKSVPCSSEYLCEAKCSRMRQCGRHQCKRKCCDESCPLCEQVCARPLGCKNHKCAAPCHGGRCYPCVQTVVVTCNCGATELTVPCGRKKDTKPPRCRELCKNPSSCHHPERKPHNCHSGPCPPCRHPCSKPLPCGHLCSAPCHSEPRVLKQSRAPGAAPWVRPAVQQPVVLPCPPCREPIAKSCKGHHEVSNLPCSEVREYSCGRKCGRRLPCGNHTCGRGCHAVINPPGDQQAGEDCLPCERGCLKPRPPDCAHPCTLPCHPGDCPRCETLLKLRCFCTTMNLFVKCCEWVSADEGRRVELQTCTSQCTKILSCGHRCPLQCHAGDCSPPEDCKKKVNLRCPCRRIKKEARCFERHQKAPKCDAECRRTQEEKEEERRREEAARREAEEREERESEEALLRQLRPRRRRSRRRVEDEEELSFFERHRTALLRAVGGCVAAVAVLGIAATYVYMQD